MLQKLQQTWHAAKEATPAWRHAANCAGGMRIGQRTATVWLDCGANSIANCEAWKQAVLTSCAFCLVDFWLRILRRQQRLLVSSHVCHSFCEGADAQRVCAAAAPVRTTRRKVTCCVAKRGNFVLRVPPLQNASGLDDSEAFCGKASRRFPLSAV